MRETTVEGFLVRRVRELGGAQAKHVSPGTDGEPDRLVKLPGCPMALLELKAPGEEPTPRQLVRLSYWRAVGVVAGYASTYVEVEAFLQEILRYGMWGFPAFASAGL